MSTTNSAPSEPEAKPTAEDAASVIDTSKMNAGQRAALELTEAARETPADRKSFVGGLFMGDCDLSAVFPFPEQNPEDRDQGDAFLQRLEKFLKEKVDPDEIKSSPNSDAWARSASRSPPNTADSASRR
jgi:hypothetical protein